MTAACGESAAGSVVASLARVADSLMWIVRMTDQPHGPEEMVNGTAFAEPGRGMSQVRTISYSRKIVPVFS